MNINNKIGDAVVSHFDNISEWMEYAATSNCTYARMSNKFTNFATGKEFTDRIKANSAPESLKTRVRDALEVSAPEQVKEVELFDIYHDQAGLFVDMTSYMMGEQDCMVNFDIISAARRTLWIVAPFGAYASATPEQFANRGIALIRAVKHLQASGVDVGVMGYSSCSTHGNQYASNHTQTVIVKHPQNELAESDFINIFATCNALRSVGFGVRKADIYCERGSTETMLKAHLKGSSLEHEQVLLMDADSAMYNFKTSAKAESFMIDQVNKALTKAGA